MQWLPWPNLDHTELLKHVYSLNHLSIPGGDRIPPPGGCMSHFPSHPLITDVAVDAAAATTHLSLLLCLSVRWALLLSAMPLCNVYGRL